RTGTGHAGHLGGPDREAQGPHGQWRRRRPARNPLEPHEEGAELMAAVPVTTHQVRSKVAWVLQKEPDALVVGLHAAGPWPGDRCLAEALLAHRPPGGEYPPVPAGVLDAATAWRAIFHHALGMEDREPDLPGLLRWAAHGAGVGRFLASPPELRDAARRRLAAT